MKIVVLDGFTLNPGDNPWDTIEALGSLTVYDRTPRDQVVPRAREADIVLTNKTPIDAESLDHLPDLKLISVQATGYNIVDVKAAREHGVAVANVPEYGTDTVAQHVFAVLLALCHQPERHDRLIRDGQWQRSGDFCFWDPARPLVELVGKRMGIIGFGRIGRRVGELAHAFGMELVAYDVRPSDPPEYKPFSWQSLETVFAQSDIVSLHCPQTAQNVGMVNRTLLATMRPTALFINAARGGLVNEQDLADALNEGRIAGAALDVLSAEPVCQDNPLLDAKNCLLTPHIAWATVEARRRLMAVTARNITAFLNGQAINIVN
jgi:glycerate dehydrogenase